MQPTYVEAGEILYRAGNNNRRGHYHAAEEAGYAWMRFVAEDDAEPVCTTPHRPRADIIANAHPGAEADTDPTPPLPRPRPRRAPSRHPPSGPWPRSGPMPPTR